MLQLHLDHNSSSSSSSDFSVDGVDLIAMQVKNDVFLPEVSLVRMIFISCLFTICLSSYLLTLMLLMFDVVFKESTLTHLTSLLGCDS